MPQRWEDYYRSQEEAELGMMAQEVERVLQQRSEGKNLRGYPVYSAGWKDADLTPEGDYGITRIEPVDEDTLRVHWGAHKTFINPGYDYDDDAAADVAQDIVSGAPGNGNWSGDDWVFSKGGTFEVLDEGDTESLVREILTKLPQVVDETQQQWALVDEQLDTLYQEMVAKYGE